VSTVGSSPARSIYDIPASLGLATLRHAKGLFWSVARRKTCVYHHHVYALVTSPPLLGRRGQNKICLCSLIGQSYTLRTCRLQVRVLPEVLGFVWYWKVNVAGAAGRLESDSAGKSVGVRVLRLPCGIVRFWRVNCVGYTGLGANEWAH
jgi:hypothetical protein